MKKLVFFVLCCISTLCVKSQQWDINFPATNGYCYLLGGAKTADGNYVIGNDKINDYSSCPVILFAYPDGNYKSARIWTEGKKWFFTSMVTLDNGNAFVAGVSNSTDDLSDTYDKLWIAIISPDLEVLEEKFFPIEGEYLTYGKQSEIIKDHDGNIVLAATITENVHPNGSYYDFDYSLFKFDQQINVLNHNYLIAESPSGVIPYDIIYVPNTDKYIIIGKGLSSSGVSNVICAIDGELNFVSCHDMPLNYSNPKASDVWVDNTHFLMATSLTIDDELHISVTMMDTTAFIERELFINKVDTVEYVAEHNCMAYVNDSTIYIATYWLRGANVPNGIVVYLMDMDMNILGTKNIRTGSSSLTASSCQASPDGGCIIQAQNKIYGFNDGYIWKVNRNEFEVNMSVTEVPEEQFKSTAFPNPANSVINISIKDVDIMNAKIIITDMSGRKCFDKKINDKGNLLSVNVSNLEIGTYCYQIVVDNQSVLSGTFVKNQ